MRVKYVGPGDFHRDRFITKKSWNGHGDVQTIDDETKARRLVDAYPNLFEEVETLNAPTGGEATGTGIGTGLPPADDGDVMSALVIVEADGDEVRAADATRGALVTYAEERLGIMVKDVWSREDLLGHIATVLKAIEELERACVGTGADLPTIGRLLAGPHDQAPEAPEPPADEAPPADPPPDDPPPDPGMEEIRTIADAIKGLPPEEIGADGVPNVAVIGKALGRHRVKASDRDAALELLRAEGAWPPEAPPADPPPDDPPPDAGTAGAGLEALTGTGDTGTGS